MFTLFIALASLATLVVAIEIALANVVATFLKTHP